MAITDGSENFHAGAAMIDIKMKRVILYVIQVLADSGCTISLMSEALARALGETILPLDRPVKFSTANRSKMQAVGRVIVTFEIEELQFTEEFLVTDCLVHSVILGCNFFRKHKADIMFSTDEFVIGKTRVPMYGSYNIGNSACAVSEIREPGDVVKINKGLTVEQEKKVKELINKFTDVFSKDSEDIGESTFVHKIDLTTETPVKKRHYRIPYTQKSIVEEEIRKMLKMDVIQKSNSPYGAPVVLVKKKDNSVRFCVDFRALNEVTIKDNYPMPYIDEELESFRGKRFFTTLDLTSGYWQFLVDEKARQYTAFNTHQGSFEFKRMPFGLCNAGATFQRQMQQLLEEYIEFARNYIDDIIISSRTFAEHLVHIEKVLLKLREARLKVKPSKTCVADEETKYLGFIVSKEGIKVCPSRSEAIANYPRPTTQKEIRSFIGFASYYRRFIEGFADVAGPLIKLLAKSAKFEWTEECTTSFEKLKACLVSPEIMAYPDFSKRFCLTTDASKIGLGAIISQPDGERENVIAYASRTLKPAERNYNTTELELLAIVWAVERFKPYLFGTVFELVTDHKPLIYLNSSASASSRLARWKLKLSDYSFDIRHKPGKDNVNADVLSRAEIVCAIEYAQNETDMKRMQEEDVRIKEILKRLNGNGVYKGFRRKEGILYCLRKNKKPYGTDEALRLVVPDVMVKEVLTTCHDYMSGAHLGQKKTIHKIGSRFYWYNWKDDVTAWINACSVCAGRKTPNRPKAPLHSIIEAEKPFDMIGIDFVGPLPKTDNGNQWLLVITDYATRWVEAFPTKDSKAITVAEILVKQIIARYGAPMKLLSDRGRQFLSDLVYQVCELYRVKKINTTAYHPQTNGLTEKFNGTLCQMLAAYMNERQTDWDEFIEICLFAYRTSKQETTKETPFRLLYGRDARLPSDIDKWSTKDSFVDEIDKAWKLAQKLIKKSAKNSEKLSEPSEVINYQKDDWVRVEKPATQVGLKRKFRRDLWSEPVQILQVNDTENVLIKETPETWVHKNRIKPAETVLRSGRISRPPIRYRAGYTQREK